MFVIKSLSTRKPMVFLYRGNTDILLEKFKQLNMGISSNTKLVAAEKIETMM